MPRGEIILNKKTCSSKRLAILRESWYKKWNRVCAVIVGILAFILLISIVMHESIFTDEQEDTTVDTKYLEIVHLTKEQKIKGPSVEIVSENPKFLGLNITRVSNEQETTIDRPITKIVPDEPKPNYALNITKISKLLTTKIEQPIIRVVPKGRRTTIDPPVIKFVSKDVELTKYDMGPPVIEIVTEEPNIRRVLDIKSIDDDLDRRNNIDVRNKHACKNLEFAFNNNRRRYGNNNKEGKKILVRKQTNGIKAEEEGDGIIKVSIYVNKKDYILVWSETSDLNYFGCFINLSYESRFKGFRPDNSYVLCMMKFYETTVSPFDCVAVKTSPPEEALPWLENREKETFISTLVTTYVVAILLTAIFVFFFIRRNPKLLKGNKRVVVVKRDKEERNKIHQVMILPNPKKKTSRVSHHHESMEGPMYPMRNPMMGNRVMGNPDFQKPNAVYLTPISQRYVHVRHNTNVENLERHYSTASLRSTTTYADPEVVEEPPHSGSRRIHRPLTEIFEQPPPLPPPRAPFDYI